MSEKDLELKSLKDERRQIQREMLGLTLTPVHMTLDQFTALEQKQLDIKQEYYEKGGMPYDPILYRHE